MGTGGFNIPDQKDANFEKFFAEDCITDVSSGAYADPEKYKVYKGRKGAPSGSISWATSTLAPSRSLRR